jgi:hypothetical protein
MNTLTISKKGFTEVLLGLIASGVTFEAVELNDYIVITFLGGY